MDSCPVCYEAFSSDSDGSIPRKLPCEHVVCTQCATESWEEDDVSLLLVIINKRVLYPLSGILE